MIETAKLPSCLMKGVLSVSIILLIVASKLVDEDASGCWKSN
jgi:hypothetical protein